MTTAFENFAPPSAFASPLRTAITQAWRKPEPQAVAELMETARGAPGDHVATQQLAHRIALVLRERKASTGRAGLVQGLLQEFALSSQEGVALMCLAEALLRIPDAATRDALIRDKIASGDWQRAPRPQRVAVRQRRDLGAADHRQAGRHAQRSRPVGARSAASDRAGRRAADPQGRRHGDAHDGRAVRHRRDDRRGARATPGQREAEGFRYSYDMLGEAALTAADARALSAPPTKPRSTRSARRRPAAASTTAPASRSSSRRCIRATAARSTSA